MGDGKALQMGTSHELGQNFARAFGIDYLAASGQRELAWTTSWGISTRLIGGLIMAHGDDLGLRVPPRLAPVQAVVLVVKEGEGVAAAAGALTAGLREAGRPGWLDDRTEVPFGRRAIDAELKGYPVRVEVGPRDVAEGRAVLVRRVTGERTAVPLDSVTRLVTEALEAGQKTLYEEALTRQRERTTEVASVPEAIEASGAGWARLPWAAVGDGGEAELNAQGVTVRCLVRADGGVPTSEDEPDLVAVVGRAYRGAAGRLAAAASASRTTRTAGWRSPPRRLTAKIWRVTGSAGHSRRAPAAARRPRRPARPRRGGQRGLAAGGQGWAPG